ncbi:MAG: hypothetical protein GEU78_13005 [Actinobacteria bacterium]|nr:hypothetical protein [Actinomycetota bacterium]
MLISFFGALIASLLWYMDAPDLVAEITRSSSWTEWWQRQMWSQPLMAGAVLAWLIATPAYFVSRDRSPTLAIVFQVVGLGAAGVITWGWLKRRHR